MLKFLMYEVVKSKNNLEKVPIGSKGTVLIIFEDGKHYEVEFVDDDGNTLNVLSVSSDDIETWVE